LKKNLILTGMMGVGKTTVGKSLSVSLKMNFIDIDRLIEEKAKMSINQIFSKKGEKHFRLMEVETTLKSLKEKESIIALGGGAFMNKAIRDSVLKDCISFWLNLDITRLMKRIYLIKKRPLLNNNNKESTLKEIYDQRKKVYNLANYKIDCNKKDKNLIVSEIIKIYESN
jgi:shikimate kinase|tara:strand:- start:10 stop:519 length:510 start_codon:yes stop_codon:yes gene_type:complete